MVLAIRESTTPTLRLRVDVDTPPASVAWKAYDHTGKLTGSGSGVVDSVSTTVVSYVEATQVLTLASVAGIEAGRFYLIETPGQGASEIRVEVIAGSTVTLAASPTIGIDSTSTLKGLEVAVTLPAAATATRGRNCHIQLTGTTTGGEPLSRRIVFDVVRTQFAPAMTAMRAKSHITSRYPGQSARYGAVFFDEIAERASKHVTTLIRADQRYPDLLGDDTAFMSAGVHALKAFLVDEGLYPGEDPGIYQDEQYDACANRISEAVRGMWYDKDDDGKPAKRERGFTSSRRVK